MGLRDAQRIRKECLSPFPSIYLMPSRLLLFSGNYDFTNILNEIESMSLL